jgi:hypothetical protein
MRRPAKLKPVLPWRRRAQFRRDVAALAKYAEGLGMPFDTCGVERVLGQVSARFSQEGRRS